MTVTAAAVVFSWLRRMVVLVFATLAAGEGESGFCPAGFQGNEKSGRGAVW